MSGASFCWAFKSNGTKSTKTKIGLNLQSMAISYIPKLFTKMDN
jgi:hypothetical protein